MLLKNSHRIITAGVIVVFAVIGFGCKGRWTVDKLGSKETIGALEASQAADARAASADTAEITAAQATASTAETVPAIATPVQPPVEMPLEPGFITLSSEEAFNLWNPNDTFGQYKWIDLRVPEEFNAGHIDGFANHPSDSVPAWASQYKHDDKIILICRTGHRSVDVAKQLEDMGFTYVSQVQGGYEGWKTDHPVTKPEMPK